MRLPNFIMVGPPRTGTTWVHEILKEHVALPRVKETQFFVWNYDLGVEWYAAHFRNASPDVTVGEIAPTYFNSPNARSRISEYIPGCRIICTLRDPVERMYSQYKKRRSQGLIKVPFEQAAFNHKELLDYNRYAFHVRAWQEWFGPENVLVLLYDDLKATPERFLREISSFIGIEQVELGNSPVARKRVNTLTVMPKSRRLARRGRQLRGRLVRMRQHRLLDALEPVLDYCAGRGEKFEPLDPKLKRRLRAHFRPEVEECEKVVKRNLSAWKELDREHPSARSIHAELR